MLVDKSRDSQWLNSHTKNEMLIFITFYIFFVDAYVSKNNNILMIEVLRLRKMLPL